MKKLLIVGTLPSLMNGSTRSFVRLSNILSNYFQTYVIIPDSSDSINVANILNPNVNVLKSKFIVPVRRSLKNILKLPLAVLEMFKLIKKIKPNILIINDIPWFYLILVAKFYKIPVIIFSRYYEPNKLVNSIIKFVLKRANKVIYVSDFNKKLWSLGNDAKNLTLYNPGIFQFKFVENFSLPDQYALIVSRIDPAKGILEGIKVFSDIAKVKSEMFLIIAGDAIYPEQFEYKSMCMEYIRENNLTNKVIWLGEVKYTHLLYKNAKFFIHLPNFEDPFPTVIMEALALGTKIITRRKGGIPEQVDGFDGVLMIDPNDYDLNILLEFIDNTHSTHKNFTLYYERYNEKKFEEKLVNIVSSIIKEEQ